MRVKLVLLIGVVIGAYNFLYASDEIVKNREGNQIQWIEGTRGWSENGTSLWTAVSPLPNYNVGIGISTPSYKLDVLGSGRFQGDLYINSWPISVTSTPTTGYVLKWTGTAFTPQPDLIGGGVGGSGQPTQVAFWTSTSEIGGSNNLWWDNTNSRLGIGTNSPQYRLDVVGASRIQGDLYINSWPISVTSAPTVGYVLKWNGTAFVPQPDVGGASEWTDAGEYLYPADDASQYTKVYESATPSSGYRFQAAYNSSIYGLIGTQYSGVQGNSNNTSGAGVFGSGGTATHGVYGVTNTSAAYFGVWGINQNASGSGVLGTGSNVTSIAWSGAGDGVVGASDAYGVIGSHYNGSNNNRWGALGTQYHGVYGSSDNASGGVGVFGRHTAASASAVGVYGTCTGGDIYDFKCVVGYDPNYSDWYGYGGYFLGGYTGVFGYNGYTGGVGYGVYGYAPASGWAVYAAGDFGASGAKSAIVKTSKGPRELYCVESPEIWFTEVGSGKLVNGRAHIELDPLFLETVTIDENNPMKVIITLTDECNGVYVKKGKTGFDVIELNNGRSNATFDYVVYAKRKGYENKRLEYTEAGYLDEHLYPNPNDPEIPAKLREKRMSMEEGKKLGEKIYRSIQEVRTAKVSLPKEALSIQEVKVTPKRSIPPAEKGFKEELKEK